jgi:hypothetical protein
MPGGSQRVKPKKRAAGVYCLATVKVKMTEWRKSGEMRRNLAKTGTSLEKRGLRPYTVPRLPCRAVKKGFRRYQGRAVQRVQNGQEEEKCLTSESERPIKRKKSAGGIEDHDGGSKIGGGAWLYAIQSAHGPDKSGETLKSTHFLLRKHPFPDAIPPSHK